LEKVPLITLVSPQKHAATTLLEVLRDRLQHRPEDAIYTFLSGEEILSLTYRELNRRSGIVAARLDEICEVGDRVLLLYPPGLNYIIALYACMQSGVIAVPAYVPRPNRPLSRLESIAADSEPALILTTQEILNSPRSVFRQADSSISLLKFLATDNIQPNLSVERKNRLISADTPVLLQYTSGSTASPKGVVLTHRHILHNTAMIQDNFPLSPESSTVFWLPPYHDMGLIGGILQPLCTGFPVYLMSPVAFLQRPIRWLRAISHFRATCSGAPNFAYDLCVRRITDDEIDGLDLSSWTVAFNGAEPIRKKTLDDFYGKFARCGFRRNSWHPCYGLAEATLMATGLEPGTEVKSESFARAALEQNQVTLSTRKNDADDHNHGDRVLVSCGLSTGKQDLIIVDPQTSEPCEPDRIGEIWISGPSIASGYWRNTEATQEVFHANLAGDLRTFLRTGDLGFLHKGELFITGRIKDLIIIHGQNHYPNDIEFTASGSHPDLSPSSSAAFSVERDGIERLILVQEFDRRRASADWKSISSDICRAIGDTHDLHVDKVVPVRAWTIPRTTSGKVQRYLCRAAFIAGTLETV
jgi:acyl-CoA synthetase (AMP-forming)/AMP-acid ligase II